MATAISNIAVHLEHLKKNATNGSLTSAMFLLSLCEENCVYNLQTTTCLPLGLTTPMMSKIVLEWASREYHGIKKLENSEISLSALGEVLIRSIRLLKPSKWSHSTISEVNNTMGHTLISCCIDLIEGQHDVIGPQCLQAMENIFTIPLYKPSFETLLEFIVTLHQRVSSSTSDNPIAESFMVILVNEASSTISKQGNLRKIYERITTLDIFEALIYSHRSATTSIHGQHMKQQLKSSVERLLNLSLFNEDMLNGLHGVASLRCQQFERLFSSENRPTWEVQDGHDTKKPKRRKRKEASDSSDNSFTESFHSCLLKSLSQLLVQSTDHLGEYGYELIFRLFSNQCFSLAETRASSLQKPDSMNTSSLTDITETIPPSMTGKRRYTLAGESSHAARLCFEGFVMLARELFRENLSGSSRIISSPNVLRCLKSLLVTVNDLNCYRIHDDHEKRHLALLSMVSNVIMQTVHGDDSLCSPSFQCLGALLTLTHLTIIDHLDRVIVLIFRCHVAVMKEEEQLFCLLIDSFAKLRKLPVLLESIFATVCHENSLVLAANAARLLNSSIVKTELEKAVIRTPVGQLDEMMKVFQNHICFITSVAPFTMNLAIQPIGETLDNTDEGKKFQDVTAEQCDVITIILQIWLSDWPVDSSTSAAFAGSLLSKCAAGLLHSVSLQSYLNELMGNQHCGAMAMEDSIELRYCLRWYSLLLLAASRCEELLPRGIDDALPPLFAQHKLPPSLLNAESITHIEADVLKLLLDRLFNHKISSLKEQETMERLSLIRMSQIHAQLGRLPLIESEVDKSDTEHQLRSEALTILDFLFSTHNQFQQKVLKQLDLCDVRDDLQLLQLTSRLLNLWAPLANEHHLQFFLRCLFRNLCVVDDTIDNIGEKLFADASFWEISVVQEWLPHTALEFLCAIIEEEEIDSQGASCTNCALLHLASEMSKSDAFSAMNHHTNLRNQHTEKWSELVSLMESNLTSNRAGVALSEKTLFKVARIGALLKAAPLPQTVPQHLATMVIGGVAIDLILKLKHAVLDSSWHSTSIASWRVVTAQWLKHLSDNASANEDLHSLFAANRRGLAWTNYLLACSDDSLIIGNDSIVSECAVYSGHKLLSDMMANIVSIQFDLFTLTNQSDCQVIFQTLVKKANEAMPCLNSSNVTTSTRKKTKLNSSTNFRVELRRWFLGSGCIQLGVLKGLAQVLTSHTKIRTENSVDHFNHFFFDSGMLELFSLLLEVSKKMVTRCSEDKQFCGLFYAVCASCLDDVLTISNKLQLIRDQNNNKVVPYIQSCELIDLESAAYFVGLQPDDQTLSSSSSSIVASIAMKACASLAYSVIASSPLASKQSYATSANLIVEAVLVPLLHYSPYLAFEGKPHQFPENHDREDIFTFLTAAFQRAIRDGLLPGDRIRLIVRLSQLLQNTQDQGKDDISPLRCLSLALDACCSPSFAVEILGNNSRPLQADENHFTVGDFNDGEDEDEDDGLIVEAKAQDLSYGLLPSVFSPGQLKLELLTEQLAHSITSHNSQILLLLHGDSNRQTTFISEIASPLQQHEVMLHAEAIALGIETLRSLIGVRSLIQVGHRLISFALHSAHQVVITSSTISTSIAMFLKSLSLKTDGKVDESLDGLNSFIQVATVITWSVEKSCMLISKLLKTHTRLIYSSASLFAQFQLLLLKATNNFVKINTNHSILQRSNLKSILIDIVARLSRATSRVVSDCCNEKHISTFRRHLPSFFLELVSVIGSWDLSTNELARQGKTDLSSGYLLAIGALGPRDTHQITTLLHGGPHDTPRAVFKELLEENSKIAKFTGRF